MLLSQRVLSLLFFLTLLVGAVMTLAARQPAEDIIVWRKTTDQRFIFGRHHMFHRSTCPSLKQADMLALRNVEHAREEGLRPCMFCLPAYDLYPVHRVIDGNTLEVRFYNEIRRVQLLGVSLPPSNDKKDAVADGKAYLKKLLDGKALELHLEYPKYMDKYDRMLVHAYLHNRNGRIVHINLKMIQLGFARYRPQPNSQFHNEFEKAQQLAKATGLGQWKQSLENE